MARRTITKDDTSHYCYGNGSESNTWNDGSRWVTGYVKSDYGIVRRARQFAFEVWA